MKAITLKALGRLLVPVVAAMLPLSPAHADPADRLVRCFTDPDNPTQQAVARRAIASLQAQGWSYGDIRVALALAQHSNENIAGIAALRTSGGVRADANPAVSDERLGIEWPEVASALGVNPKVITGGFVNQNALACWSEGPR